MEIIRAQALRSGVNRLGVALFAIPNRGAPYFNKVSNNRCYTA